MSNRNAKDTTLKTHKDTHKDEGNGQNGQSRSTRPSRQNAVEEARDSKKDTFLKVAPSLFTAAKLPLFDSLDLYTTLIKNSEALEQGERLRNLSWRIMNKALLKDHELNKSKKRDGVKNLYRVINPAQNPQFPEHARQPVEKQQPLQIMSAMRGHPVPQQQQQQQNHQHHASSHYLSPTGHMPARVTSDLQAKRGVHKPHELPLARPPTSQGNVRFTLGSDGGSRMTSPEPNKQSMTGLLDAQLPATKKKDILLPRTSALTDAVFEETDDQRPEKPTRRLLHQPQSTGSLFATRSHDKMAHGTRDHLSDQKPKSLFGPPLSQPKLASGTHSSHNGAFYSSDEDESEWNSLSDDSELYDEDEDERYYQKQWDKLMFSRNDISRGTISSRGTTSPSSDKQDPKRSLLSGLFLNEMSKKPAPPIMSSVSVQHPTLEKSSVTAVGDVTPSSSWKGGLSAINEAMIHDKTATHPHAHPGTGYIPHQRGSFSSIISDSTRQRYKHESNAPPTAQTILPTALSTHMFLPNNVHQQRLAKSSLSSSSPSSKSVPLKRRESMDIPSKKSTNSFLKTRVELSEEQYLSRALNGR
ncbi:LAFA_0F20428g1_1 [Lachancea sp. 'fantastica']|nr:LAFA_0F20428g1_1 [Lachancea sp. 'fantastica']